MVALDNLKRRGSELALPRLAAADVEFVHGDIRNPEDLDVGEIGLLVECSAEPSVRAGYDADPRYLINTNLSGTIHCLERARRDSASVIFLSTSRVYPIAGLRALPLVRRGDRMVIAAGEHGPGWSEHGIARDFSLSGARSLYGATKLCSEHLIEEYGNLYGLKTIINRCGVIAGPWQMGKVDQGFFVLWAARHHYRRELLYQGFDGLGLQVRDVLHIADLTDLVMLQVAELEKHQGKLYTLGGGAERSVSLRELTSLCAEISGWHTEPQPRPETHPSDVPYFVADNREVRAATGWSPKRSVGDTLGDVFDWLARENANLKGILG